MLKSHAVSEKSVTKILGAILILRLPAKLCELEVDHGAS